MKKQTFLLVIACSAFLFSAAVAQTNMQVYKKTGSMDNYSIYSIRKITFDSTATMTVHETSAVKDYYTISGIRKLTFKNLATGNPEAPDFQTGALKIYPNPATDILTIEFDLMKSEQGVLKIFNVYGELMKREVVGKNLTGSGKYIWNRTNDAGVRVASGTYICYLILSDKILTEKIIIY